MTSCGLGWYWPICSSNVSYRATGPTTGLGRSLKFTNVGFRAWERGSRSREHSLDHADPDAKGSRGLLLPDTLAGKLPNALLDSA